MNEAGMLDGQPQPRSTTVLWNLLVLACFAALIVVMGIRWRPSTGFDLAPSYLGCRLFLSGHADHLYPRNLTVFNSTTDPVWRQTANASHFAPSMPLTPYIQTPLWGYSLQPLCRATSFTTFNRIFLVIAALCFAGFVWLVAKFWCPRLFHPLWLMLVCLGFLVTEPLRNAITLTQTHIIFMLMTVFAIILARRGHPIWAGVLLAGAAAVKISPVFLLIYWLIIGRGKAAVSFILTSIGLFGLALAATGHDVVLAWLQSMTRVSNVLLVALNNQSLAAWWMGHIYPAAEASSWHSLPLPPAMKAVSMVLLIVTAVAGGLMDRRLQKIVPSTPPYGAVLTLLGATIFTPIAWSHYYIVLVIPVMLLLDENLRRRSWRLLLIAVAIVLPNVLYFARGHADRLHFHVPVIIRSEFYSGILAMLSIGLLYRLRTAEYHPLPLN